MQTLPTELVLQICLALSKPDILSLRATCTKFARDCEELAFAGLKIMCTTAELQRLACISQTRFGRYVKRIEINTVRLGLSDFRAINGLVHFAIEEERARGDRLRRLPPTREQVNDYLLSIIADQRRMAHRPIACTLFRAALGGLSFLHTVRIYTTSAKQWCPPIKNRYDISEWHYQNERRDVTGEWAQQVSTNQFERSTFPELISLALPSPTRAIAGLNADDPYFNATLLSAVLEGLSHRSRFYDNSYIKQLNCVVHCDGPLASKDFLSKASSDCRLFKSTWMISALQRVEDFSLGLRLGQSYGEKQCSELIHMLGLMTGLRRLRLGYYVWHDGRASSVAAFLATHVWPLLEYAELTFTIDIAPVISFARNHASTLETLLLNETGIGGEVEREVLESIAAKLRRTRYFSSWRGGPGYSRVMHIHAIHRDPVALLPFYWEIPALRERSPEVETWSDRVQIRP